MEQEKIGLLRERLGIIYDPNYSTLGHGTNEEAAKKILMNGLSTKPGMTLNETAIPIFYSEKPYTEQPDEVFSNILHWQHKDYKYIVIVMIPNPKDGQTGGLRHFNSVLESQIHPEWRERDVISPKFIKGYIDANSLQFVENSLYDKDAEVLVKEVSTHSGPSVSHLPKDIPSAPSGERKGEDDEGDVW